MKQDSSGLALVLLGAVVIGFLFFGGRVSRRLGRDAWRRVRWIRWIFVAIAVVVLVTLYQRTY